MGRCAGLALLTVAVVFNLQFARSHVSRLDYFHPNLAGQAELAWVTWAHAWWK
jgi:hypothetical protein